MSKMNPVLRQAPTSHDFHPVDSSGSTPACPACASRSSAKSIERYGKYNLFECAHCSLHFWDPRVMPDSQWYGLMYGGRDAQVLPLEPGHRYFLADPLAPGRGDLLDIGCGTGNFLMAATGAGYNVSGTELDRNAAKFTMEVLRLPRVYSLTATEFASQYPGAQFDVVTFFEVLEHQASPGEFIASIRKIVRHSGLIALSVPNRERWLTGPDVLDYPPNHFLRWNVTALGWFLSEHGFEVLHMREQPADLRHTALMLNMATRTGLKSTTGIPTSSFRDIMQMEPEAATAALQTKPTLRHRALEIAANVKSLACFPLAAVAYPFVRARGLRGTYLYCLARRRE